MVIPVERRKIQICRGEGLNIVSTVRKAALEDERNDCDSPLTVLQHASCAIRELENDCQRYYVWYQFRCECFTVVTSTIVNEEYEDIEPQCRFVAQGGRPIVFMHLFEHFLLAARHEDNGMC